MDGSLIDFDPSVYIEEVTNSTLRYAPLQSGSKNTASASNKDVQIHIGAITDNRATVKFTYKGKTKTYLINQQQTKKKEPLGSFFLFILQLSFHSRCKYPSAILN